MPPLAATWIPLALILPGTGASPPTGSAAEAPPARELLLELCETTRLAGTRGGYVAATAVARRLEAAGWRAEIEAREVLLTYPRRIEVELFAAPEGPVLAERIDAFDPDAIPDAGVPLWNAWSASGEVRGKIVDVGRGLREDYERLRAAKVELAGAIALAQYGGSYRGVKLDLAAQHGCAAILLWSAPESDGAARGPTWPAGPWKPEHEAQRGSVALMGRTPGDPSTPGWASPKPGEKAKRLAGAELAACLPTIPCLPIGAGEAAMLRARLTRVDVAGEERAIGPGPCEARLVVDAPPVVRTIWNVVGTLPGDAEAGATDEFVLAGAHRDAWVRGAHDNGTGCVVLLRAAQILGARAGDGWKPPRTLKLAFWDAEEFGLIGSTEWAEARAEELQRSCIAYVNTDASVSGPALRGVSGTPGLEGALEAALARVTLADGGDLAAAWRASPRFERGPGLPGGGSDFAVFVHHLSLPYLELGFGENGGGQYHTAFDDVPVFERYIDPGYVGCELAARAHVELLLELARRGRAAVDGAAAAARYAREAAQLASASAERQPELAKAATEIANALTELSAVFAAHPDPARAEAGWRIVRELSEPNGLLERAWFKNALWSPGLEDGYGSETFPTLRAAAGDPAELAAASAALIARVRGFARAAGAGSGDSGGN